MEFMKTLVFRSGPAPSAPFRAQSALSPRLFFPACFFLLISRPSIFLARNLVRCCMQKVHRLVMYFLRYIKPYILWDVRITAVAAAVTCSAGTRYRLGGGRGRMRVGYVKGRCEDTRITFRARASDWCDSGGHPSRRLRLSTPLR